MRNEFTAIVERDGKWYIAYCPEIPGANGQGSTKEECLESLREAITLILEDRSAGTCDPGGQGAAEEPAGGVM